MAFAFALSPPVADYPETQPSDLAPIPYVSLLAFTPFKSLTGACKHQPHHERRRLDAGEPWLYHPAPCQQHRALESAPRETTGYVGKELSFPAGYAGAAGPLLAVQGWDTHPSYRRLPWTNLSSPLSHSSAEKGFSSCLTCAWVLPSFPYL